MRELCVRADGPRYDPPFHDTIFAAHSANRGPAAYAYMHEDFLNLGFGICAIQALGSFDPSQGGHLYFPQLGFATEFPPGSTILLPSAAITHGNVPVRKHEKRASLVHYSAAGLFRWVRYRFQTMKAAAIATPLLFARLHEERGEARLKEALGMFSTPDELFHDHARVFHGAL